MRCGTRREPTATLASHYHYFIEPCVRLKDPAAVCKGQNFTLHDWGSTHAEWVLTRLGCPKGLATMLVEPGKIANRYPHVPQLRGANKATIAELGVTGNQIHNAFEAERVKVVAHRDAVKRFQALLDGIKKANKAGLAMAPE